MSLLKKCSVDIERQTGTTSWLATPREENESHCTGRVGSGLNEISRGTLHLCSSYFSTRERHRRYQEIAQFVHPLNEGGVGDARDGALCLQLATTNGGQDHESSRHRWHRRRRRRLLLRDRRSRQSAAASLPPVVNETFSFFDVRRDRVLC